MKVYTKTGDSGTTALLGGERVSKYHPHIVVYGELDELNSLVGMLHASLTTGTEREFLLGVQADLFQMGAWLALLPGSPLIERLAPLREEQVRQLEEQIDIWQGELPELKSFVLPGGDSSAALAHLARTVCRRTERGVCQLLDALPEGAYRIQIQRVAVYLNRLSDALFMLARVINVMRGVSENVWHPVAH
ncbi:cob(I)yrinic acid a,c-diamide adenosyltransferase [Chrysiogenes arsenatis]|uniref:cob(I)yrinic acid a,c-diamide adenosyltransferase n=1 Tax=Chrysiogenes arsenatis TaxID=309797 RepID=UPI00040A1368|nr:cob(I)yrinic acid a,c-diamide adenosyltransferase [Chrysiogenes arsenatis]